MTLFNLLNPAALLLIFLIITYGFSIYEKASDWSGTIAYIRNHFNNTPIEKHTKLLIAMLFFLEVLSVIFMTYGLIDLTFNGNKLIAEIGIKISCICIISMLIGQRFAKDYEGATSLTVYFILSIIGLYLLQ